MKSQFDAKREPDGSYAVRVPPGERKPRDWPAIAFMMLAGAGLVAMFSGAARWLSSW
ncbi:hypothetical protein [Aureimonas sp. AU4]|uniref:hypothetical protein n=1 Tax=Aureimonas sp. AU4 TaxID=1638163 RepID=UPI000A8F415D|nr:hypothetical protein [Aureimonas sp. AU4]